MTMLTLRRVPKGSEDQRERGRRLREARRRAGLKQEELADRAGLPRTNLPGWERGTRGISQETAEKLAAQLPGLEAADLVEILSPSFLAMFREVAARLERIEADLKGRAT
jgi:transcriptional regulator with XRE-family HTH domain